MWLRNYYNAITAALLADDNTSSSTPPTSYTPPIRFKTTNGATVALPSLSYGANNNTAICAAIEVGKKGLNLLTSDTGSFSGSSSMCGLFLGTGSTPATYEDYRVEELITSGLTLISTAGILEDETAFDSGTHHISSKRNYTINNSSGSSITISEIGICIKPDGANNVLIYREVLDTPVTLAPSESMILAFARDGEVYNYTPYPA